MIIWGELMDLNTYIRAVSNNRFGGGKVKKEEIKRVYLECKNQKIKPIINYPVTIRFRWYCKNNRKDLDNVAFAKKMVLDGMVMAGVLKNDSRKFVSGFEDVFFIDKKSPRVEVDYL